MTEKSELDWFEFETRMRNIVNALIQPILVSFSDNSTKIDFLEKSLEKNSKRLKLVEDLTGHPNSKIGWIKETESAINALSLELKLSSTSFNQQLFEVKQDTKNTQVSMQESKAVLDNYSKQIGLIETHLNQTQDTLHNTNTNFYNYFTQTQEDVATRFNILNTLITECNRLTEQSLKKTAELTQKTNESFQHIDKMRLMMRDQSMQMIQLVHEKATLEDFMKFGDTVDRKIEIFSEKLRVIENKLHETVRYLNIYMPFDMQVLISDNLYSFLNKKSLKTWARFEDRRRKELQKKATDFESVSDIEEIVKNTLNSIKVSENRKDDIYFKLIRRKIEEEDSSSEEDSKKQRKHAALTMRAAPVGAIGLDLDNDLIEQIHKGQLELKRIDELTKSLKAFQDTVLVNFQSSIDEEKVHVQILENLIIETRKQDNEIFTKDLLQYSEKVEGYKHKLRSCYEAILNLSELVSSLVEFSLVTNAVLDQEEKDKKDLGKAGSELHLPPVSVRKNSMHHSEFLSGKALFIKPTAQYTPTPLKYKNTIYTREEIIELIGKIISNAWTEASTKPPFLSKTLKQKNNSKNLSSTLNLSSSLLKP